MARVQRSAARIRKEFKEFEELQEFKNRRQESESRSQEAFGLAWDSCFPFECRAVPLELFKQFSCLRISNDYSSTCLRQDKLPVIAVTDWKDSTRSFMHPVVCPEFVENEKH